MDLISRQAAIDVLNVGAELLRRVLDVADIVGAERAKYEWGLGLIESYISDMKEIPSAQPDGVDLFPDTEEYKKGYRDGVRDKSEFVVSRQAAMDAIDKIFPADPMRNDYTQGIACGAALAKTYVEQLPSAQLEKVDTPTVDTPTCEDAVSRQAVKEWLAKWEGYIDADIIARMQYRIIDIPSAQPEMIREIRKWINSGNRGNADYFIVEKIEEIINKYE